VEHDDMNVLVLGGRVVGIELARELIHAFVNASFTAEARHRRRLAKMTALENRLRALQVFGQSVWLDYIRRSLITSGDLRRSIYEDGLAGVTSNPAIFEKAIAGSSDYKDILEAPEARTLGAKTLYENLAVRDIQDAADALLLVYEATAKRDGYVSLEVKLTRAPGDGAPIGGLKVVTENGWLPARPSGTENIYKIYAESFKDQQHLGAIVNEAQRIVKDALESVDSSCPGGRRVDER
jgi:hypothetical protein